MSASDRANVARIRHELAAASDAKYREQIERLVPGIRTLGVRVPKLRALAAEIAKVKPALDEACELCDALCASGVRDEFLVGVFVLAKQGKRLAKLEWPRIASWLEHVDNWETCDQLAMGVAAPLVGARNELARELVALTRAKNAWKRRFAVATAAALNQKGRELPDVTLAICAPLVGDAEPSVRKALAWALREASEVDELAVFRFLEKHAPRLAPAVLREASEKLPPAHRTALGLR